MKRATAEIIREYGPFEHIDQVAGVTYDGKHVWFASGDRVNALDPDSGEIVGSIEVPAHAGSAFDGQHLYQLADERIQKVDPKTSRVLSTIPSPAGGGSGLAWAEGSLWVGQHRARKIHQVDPETGAILRTIDSNRFVTGVTWSDGELWHATWEGDESELRRIDPETGEVLERLTGGAAGDQRLERRRVIGDVVATQSRGEQFSARAAPDVRRQQLRIDVGRLHPRGGERLRRPSEQVGQAGGSASCGRAGIVRGDHEPSHPSRARRRMPRGRPVHP